MKPRVVIAGGSGSLGRAIVNHLTSRGYQIAVLTRRVREELDFEQLLWDGKTVDESWGSALDGSILINLAGELVDRIPTRRNFELLKSSRVEPTVTLAKAAHEFGKPALWLQASTLAIYGDAKELELDESSTPASEPPQMTEVAKAWERSVSEEDAGRLIYLRTAVVLQKQTPALQRLVSMTKMFMGGTVAGGEQWVSWVHIADFLAALDFMIEHQEIHGIVHVTSPEPVRNRELMATLRKHLHRPWMPPTPALLVKVGAWLLFRTDPALALTGRRARPKKLMERGFVFAFSTLSSALDDLLC